MQCGVCSFTDGMCYTSNPPKVKCTLTGTYHYYGDECDCESIRSTREQENPSLIKSIVKDVDYLSCPSLTLTERELAEFLASDSIAYEAVTTICVPCLICGEDVPMGLYGNSSKICDSCKEAVKFVKDKLMEKKND